MSWKLILAFVEEYTGLNLQMQFPPAAHPDTRYLTSDSSRLILGRAEKRLYGMIQRSTPFPNLAAHHLLYFSHCELLNGCQGLPSTGVDVNEQSSNKLNLVSYQRPNWNSKVSSESGKRYVMQWLNFLYLLAAAFQTL